MNELSTEKMMSTRELAEVLGVSTRSVQMEAEKLANLSSPVFEKVVKNSQGGFMFNEEQATAIKLALQNKTRSGVNMLSPKTDVEKQMFIAQAMQMQQEMIIELQARAEQAENKLLEEQSYIDFAHQVTESKDYLDMGQTAKLVGIGRTKLFEKLRNSNVLMSNNIPYQKYIDCGYFRTIESKYTMPNGDIKINIKTIVSQKGVKYISGLIKEVA